ncbi:MAG: hypothetical protein GX322_05325 [Firmicutes bacterium]|nr:hypothetical protein [Bacillota bacterium]
MGKHKSRRKRGKDSDLESMVGSALQALSQVKSIVDKAAGITTSLQALIGSYQAMQSDGSWDLLLSALNAQAEPKSTGIRPPLDSVSE